MHKPELLAPAGSKEALIAAVENGADAVFLGGTSFSARQYASNFTDEELERAIDYAHMRSVKAYVTVNTLVKDSELEAACKYLQFLCNAGADAVIVQDMGILRLLREQLPELPVHASTQMTIHNAEGVKLLREMGVKRVVLARELSLDGIRRIKSETAMEIETFIHGALCFSYSGQCLLSSMIGGRSGNRGYCAQPCRRKYRLGEMEGYLLSPRDLNMSEHIGALVDAGIDSFKIEGRMKRPEYVAGVVRVYRNLIDRYLESPESFQVSKDEKHMLRQLFNRGFTTGYFSGNQGGELMSRRYPHNRGTELGKVIDYEPRKKMASIALKAPLRIGDGIGIGESGIIIRTMFADNHRINVAAPGSTVKIPLGDDISRSDLSRGDMVFKTYDSQLMTSLETKAIKKIPVRMAIKARTGEPVELSINDGENEVAVKGMSALTAKNKPLSRKTIADQLTKLGNTVFEAHEVAFEIDKNIFIPVSELNSLRRDVISQLENRRAQKWKRRCSKPVIPEKSEKSLERKNMESRPVLSVNAGSIECLEAAIDSGADVVYIGNEPQMNADERRFLNKQNLSYAIEYGKDKGVSVLISTPRISKELGHLNTELNPDGFLVANLGVLYSFNRLNAATQIIVDYPLNIFNRLAMRYFLNYSQRVTLSPELTLNEIKNLASSGPAECIVHGLFPLVVSEHGLVRGLFPGDRLRDACLKDEKGFAFPVRTDMQGRTCIMNSRELCMLEYVPEIMEAGVECLRIEAGMYDKDKTGKITKAYREAMDKRRGRDCEGEYTTGHYFRGVV